MTSTTKVSRKDLTQQQAKEALTYDATTGNLIWNSGIHSKRMHAGSIAGSLNKKSGYREVSLFGTTYAAHRLIWFMETGVWPEQVDHIDQCRSNNKWSNLRAVTKAENARNRSRNPHSKTGEVGIWYDMRRFKYVAEITFNGEKVFQKSYDNIDDAIRERKAKSIELGFHENHGSNKTGI